MSDPDKPHDMVAGSHAADQIAGEAREWVVRMAAGQLTAADLARLDGWRTTSRDHRRAFARANLLWNTLGKVAEEAKVRDAAVDRRARVSSSRRMTRRSVLVGSAAAASVAYLVARPPLHLWPAASELMAPLRTATGERRKLAIASGITIDMDSQTSLGDPIATDRQHNVELISGQLAVTVKSDAGRPVAIAAAGGESRAEQARFDVKYIGATVCVTCVEGLVETSYRSKRVAIGPGQQVNYGGSDLGALVTIDPAVATAWQRGLLIFRDVPLEQVIDEVNRYRTGKIILVNRSLSQRRVMAGFRTDQIDDVVSYFTEAFGARARSLPGGIVLLS